MLSRPIHELAERQPESTSSDGSMRHEQIKTIDCETRNGVAKTFANDLIAVIGSAQGSLLAILCLKSTAVTRREGKSRYPDWKTDIALIRLQMRGGGEPYRWQD